MPARRWFACTLLFYLLSVLVSPQSDAWIRKQEDVTTLTKAVTIQKGDTLRILAARHLGDPNRWKEFLKVNHFSNPNSLSPGELLYVPITGTAVTPTEARPTVVRPETFPSTTQRRPAVLRWVSERTAFPSGMPQMLVVRAEDAAGNALPDVQVEWILHRSPRAVGDILEAADRGKRDNRYAVTRTGAEGETLDMGDASFHVGMGESWIRVQAVRPGTMDITVLCPEIPRKLGNLSTRSFQWIDLTWERVDHGERVIDAVNPSANVAIIPVQLRRPSDGAPIPGVDVRYTLKPGGPQASLGGDTMELVTVTDLLGRAEMRLSLQDLTAGTHHVQIEILSKDGSPLGSYMYTQVWRAPALSLQQEGPTTLGMLEEAEYTLHLLNRGERAVADAKLTATLPAEGLEIVSASEEGVQTGSQIVWELGSVAAGEELMRRFTLRALDQGAWQEEITLTTPDGVRARLLPQMTVALPTLQLEISAPENVRRGELIPYTTKVQNRSLLRATRVLVYHTLPDADMTVVDSSNTVSREGQNVLWYVDVLEPNASNTLTFRIQGANPGVQTLQARVTSIEGAEAHAQVATTVTAPLLVLELTPATTATNLGGTFLIQLRVQNNGSQAAKEITLICSVPAQFTLVDASDGGTLKSDNRVLWKLPTLAAGESKTLGLRLKSIAEGVHVLRAALISAEEEIVATEASISVVARPVLQTHTTDDADPIRVGEEVTYTTVVENVGRGSATEVTLSITLPDGLRVIETTSTAGRRTMQGNSLNFSLGTIEGGRQATVTVRLLALRPGDFLHSALLSYAEFGQPMRTEEPTTVIE